VCFSSTHGAPGAQAFVNVGGTFPLSYGVGATGPRDVAELTTGHIIFFTLYVNAGTWSLKCIKVRQVIAAITLTPVRRKRHVQFSTSAPNFRGKLGGRRVVC